jgi:hypothetical protein
MGQTPNKMCLQEKMPCHWMLYMGLLLGYPLKSLIAPLPMLNDYEKILRMYSCTRTGQSTFRPQVEGPKEYFDARLNKRRFELVT